MNRMCPSEEILSAYLSNTLPYDQKIWIEEHLIKCDKCRILIADTHKIVNEFDLKHSLRHILSLFTHNIFLMISLVTLVLSFLFPEYFLQFLTASVLSGIKWIVDSKSIKMLIMIHEAWKHGNKDNLSDSPHNSLHK